MRPYEAMIVLRPVLEEGVLESILNRLQSVITRQGGEVTHIDQWGKRRLAYTIDDHIEGFYVVMKFRGSPGITAELERILRITDGVMRFLVVRDEIPVAEPAQGSADETANDAVAKEADEADVAQTEQPPAEAQAEAVAAEQGADPAQVAAAEADATDKSGEA